MDGKDQQALLESIVRDLGARPDVPDLQTLLCALIQEQRRTNDVLQNLAESIAEMTEAMNAPTYVEEDAPAGDPHAGL